jgi:hypothetical protein
MKNTLIIILIFLSTAVGATTYYIDPSGNDSNNGSSGSPWKTLAYACSKATSSGDVIHVNAGTYTETAQSMLAVGVSIEGAGVISVIQSHVGGSSFTIYLYSSSQGTNGNQHISNIKMDGNALTAYGAIKIDRRSNVEIYNCTFVDFNYWGVFFQGGESPTVYSSGNKFHNNIVTNCAGYYGGEGKGNLAACGQDGMLIYNNVITQNRGTNDGVCIKGVEGYNKNVKIHNNTLSKTFTAGTTSWDFAIEIWNWLGGNEVYNNSITGSVDVGGRSNTKGTSTYSTWIHDNTIGQNALIASENIHGILLEGECEDVIIERNYIKNVAQGIPYGIIWATPENFKNIRISYNILYNIGVADTFTDWKGWGIRSQSSYGALHSSDNIEIWNNTIISHTYGGRTAMLGIGVPSFSTATNVSIRNNIIQGFAYAVYGSLGVTGASVDYLSVENNSFYQNGYSNIQYDGITPTHNTTQNNITTNPLFVSSSDFHLQTGSPAINTGLHIATLLYDYDDMMIGNPPEIGAYEKQ